jgi:hypothetical protein
MRLGVSYGVFSGLDLLKPSLKNIRPLAHHIVVVWSRVSSTGEKAPRWMVPLLQSLMSEKLIDELLEFLPRRSIRPIEMQDNCRMKREIGRVACHAAGCDYHLVMDCDEFWDRKQFESQTRVFEATDASAAPIVEYAGPPTNRFRKLSDLYVPVVHRISSPFHRDNPFPVKVDVGRTVKPVGSYKVFFPEELVLHHFTLVRYNEEELKRKYHGHGHLHRMFMKGEEPERDFLTWTRGFDPVQFERVEDRFGIEAYWKGEFQQWIK